MAQIKENEGLGFNLSQKLSQSDVSYPSSAIGVLCINGKPTGTAFIIGPKTIVTCASLCVPAEESQPGTALSFTPAEHSAEYSKKYQIRKVHLVQLFKADQNEPQPQNSRAFLSDFALLVADTDENLEEKYGSLGYDFDWLSEAE